MRKAVLALVATCIGVVLISGIGAVIVLQPSQNPGRIGSKRTASMPTGVLAGG